MRSFSNILALAASLPTAFAVSQGFNYGSVNSDGSFRFQADFQREFKLAKELTGTSGFNSARLYTMIQGGSSTNEPIQAIPAAIEEETTLLLGIWASSGEGFLQAEITALKSAIDKWGSSFTDLVVGISVGNEDLYRISPTGIAAKSGYGADPQTVANYIGEVRKALQGTPLSGSPIGHVDTWTAWVNGSNQAVIDAVDWVGFDAYPYFQNSQSNGIENGQALFEQAFSDTQNAVGGKDIWITETGWPVSGSTENLAVPSTENAKAYWDAVGCPRFGKINTWWFTLQDATPTTPNPSFGIVGAGSDTPLFDLSCDAASSSSSSSSKPSSSTTASAASASASASSASSTAAAATTSEASSAASVSSSASSEAPVVSSGGGLSPTQGGGGSVAPINSTVTKSTVSGVPTGASNTSVTTGKPPVVTATTVVQGSGATSAAPSSSSATTVSSNDAVTVGGSIFSAAGALFVALLAL